MATDPTQKEIREAYSDYTQASSHNREQGKIDMRFVAGDPWDPEDRQAREDAHRPCMSFDEIGQYLNQWKAQIRINKRAIEISPESLDADPKDAERRANGIRGIERKSDAQMTYITAGDNMIMRAAGYGRITIQPVGGRSFDKELCLKPVPNPDTITYAPGYRMPDGSDVEEAFELDTMSHTAFKRRFGAKAKTTDFTGEDMKVARNWIRDDDVQVAGFWKVHIDHRNLLLVETENGEELLYEDELEKLFAGRGRKGADGKFTAMRKFYNVKREEKQEKRRVVQYLTNGLEILDKVPWIGSRIPLPACFGKELFMDLGDGPKRHLISMVRLARDPQMFHAYAISQEAEEFGQAPKAPLAGFVGQFQTDSDAIENSNKVPTSSLQFDVPTDWNAGWGAPPLPGRPQFQPNIESFERAKESSRNSIQSAMGIMPQSTDVKKTDDKSGIAMEHIERMEAIGSMDYTENYDRFIKNCGWQLNEAWDEVNDTDRHVPIVKADGTPGIMRVMPYEVQDPEAPQMPQEPADPKAPDVLYTGRGKFGVAISVGPDHDSEVKEAAEFIDRLLEYLPTLGMPPEIIKLILAKAVKMRGLGAFGQEIADILSPPEEGDMPPEIQALVANLKGQLSQLAQENQALLMDKAGKTLELQNKIQVEGMKLAGSETSKRIDQITRIVVAEIAKGSKVEAIKAQLDAEKELALLGFNQKKDLALHASAHDVAMRDSTPIEPEAPAAQ